MNESASRLRLIATAHGDPYDPRTNSGIPARLLAALKAECDVVGTVSSKPTDLEQRLAQLRSFAPTKSAWRSRYRLSMYQVEIATKAAERGFRALRGVESDALFQIGTYFDATPFVRESIFPYVDHDLPSLVRFDPRMRRTSLTAGYVRRRIGHEKTVFDGSARILTFSEWCKDRIAEDYAIDRDRIQCVGAGSNIDSALLAREPAYDACHAVFIGFDFERKGGKDVLEAFARVRSTLPSARLTIVGGLPKGEVAAGVLSTGQLVGEGSTARIAEILASASLYVMPSVFEPFGIAFLEAMSAGLPCIGSDRCAIPEIIGETGGIVPAGNPEELARVMYAFLSDPELCRRRGGEARARYRERYGWANVSRNIRLTIERSLQER